MNENTTKLKSSDGVTTHVPHIFSPYSYIPSTVQGPTKGAVLFIIWFNSTCHVNAFWYLLLDIRPIIARPRPALNGASWQSSSIQKRVYRSSGDGDSRTTTHRGLWWNTTFFDSTAQQTKTVPVSDKSAAFKYPSECPFSMFSYIAFVHQPVKFPRRKLLGLFPYITATCPPPPPNPLISRALLALLALLV